MQDNVLKSLSTGVYVLTAQNQGKQNGSTVTWVTPVSFDPLLVMVSLGRVRVSHDLVKKSGYFGLNVLTEAQTELARDFGFKSARDTDKFADVAYTTSVNGLPILDGVKSFIECRVINTFPAAEHTMFVGK